MNGMNTIPFLKEGDSVALCATARAVSPDEMTVAVSELTSWGLNVVIPKGIYEREGQLAGSDKHRAAMLQRLLDDESIRAIVCCRGGYGTVRIIDRLDFSRFAEHPKWIVGYSDVTVLHSHIQRTLGLPTLHATMPINMHGDETPATRTMRDFLFGRKPDFVDYEWEPSALNRKGVAHASVVGGNLSILYSLCGSCSQIDTRGKILLIEDLDEYLYHIDRMMMNLKRNGMLDGLAGLLVGGLTDMHDNTVPFGRTAMQVVADAVQEYDYPVLFNAPFGHLGDNNLAIPLGMNCTIESSNSKKCRIFAP